MSENVLEPAAAEFADAAAHAPQVYELSPRAARTSLADIQAGRVAKPDVDSALEAELPCRMGGVEIGTSDPAPDVSSPQPAAVDCIRWGTAVQS